MNIHADGTTVVVCAYTMARWRDIVDGMQALTQQSHAPTEVVLVVDHNSELFERAQADIPAYVPAVRVVENRYEKGLSGARNTAIDVASQPIIAFLDDDAVPEARWLEELVAPFADPQVLVTGGRAVASWPVQRPGWFPAEFDWVVGCSYVGLPTESGPLRNVMGCSMAFRADVFDLVGRFTEGIGRVGRLPLGCEETELCIRIGQTGTAHSIVYAPDSVVQHRVSSDRVRFEYFRRRCLAEGKSKAAIGALVGHQSSTSTERDYATRVLPMGVGRALLSCLKGDLSGAARATAIVSGLLLTAAGYARARLQLLRSGTA